MNKTVAYSKKEMRGNLKASWWSDERLLVSCLAKTIKMSHSDQLRSREGIVQASLSHLIWPVLCRCKMHMSQRIKRDFFHYFPDCIIHHAMPTFNSPRKHGSSVQLSLSC